MKKSTKRMSLHRETLHLLASATGGITGNTVRDFTGKTACFNCELTYHGCNTNPGNPDTATFAGCA